MAGDGRPSAMFAAPRHHRTHRPAAMTGRGKGGKGLGKSTMTLEEIEAYEEEQRSLRKAERAARTKRAEVLYKMDTMEARRRALEESSDEDDYSDEDIIHDDNEEEIRRDREAMLEEEARQAAEQVRQDALQRERLELEERRRALQREQDERLAAEKRQRLAAETQEKAAAILAAEKRPAKPAKSAKKHTSKRPEGERRARKIQKFLAKRGGGEYTAKEIAGGLGLDRTEVNSILYKFTNLFEKGHPLGSVPRWRLRGAVSGSVAQPPAPAAPEFSVLTTPPPGFFYQVAEPAPASPRTEFRSPLWSLRIQEQRANRQAILALAGLAAMPAGSNAAAELPSDVLARIFGFM